MKVYKLCLFIVTVYPRDKDIYLLIYLFWGVRALLSIWHQPKPTTVQYLDELLCRVNILLVRKHNQSVRDHLKLLQGPPYSPFENLSDLCERTTCKYEHARYGSKVI